MTDQRLLLALLVEADLRVMGKRMCIAPRRLVEYTVPPRADIACGDGRARESTTRSFGTGVLANECSLDC